MFSQQRPPGLFGGLTLVTLLAFSCPVFLGMAKAGPTIAPDFELPLLLKSGKVKLTDYRGQVVLIDFWASWCAPCRKLMPKIGELQARLPALKVLAISEDTDESKAKSFAKKGDSTLTFLWDGEQTIAEKFALEGMPSSYLIDKQGHLRFRHDGYTESDFKEIETQIQLLMKEPK